MNVLNSPLSDIFQISKDEYCYELLKHGHINKTFRIIRNGVPLYILQKINHEVFTDIEKLMENYTLVTNYLAAVKWPPKLSLRTPEVIICNNGKSFYTDDEQNSWRLITYIEGADTNNVTGTAEISYQGGLAFGTFLSAIQGIDPDSLNDILPDFHSLERRYNEFLLACKSDLAGKVGMFPDEIRFVKDLQPGMRQIPDSISSGKIPARVVHNDTKLTNVIYSEAGKAVGIIDLDTIMVGSVLYDFGDAIRSLANAANEDEQDLSKVRFEPDFFEAFSKGFIETSYSFLNKYELDLLPESALLMTYIIGMRFLTDYFNGNIYYRTNYADHNLVRARVQFHLLAQMEKQTDKMHLIINKIRKAVSQNNISEN